MKSRSWIVFGAALALTVALPVIGHGKDGKDNDRPAKEWTVNFGQPQPQTPDPAPVGAAVTHFLDPNDLTIVKGDSVNFIVNGGGHGIAIHPVAKGTTRAQIAEDLCDGAIPENPDPIVDRRTRATTTPTHPGCNGAVVTGVVNSGVSIVGTQNLEYQIKDAKNNLIIDTGFNVVIPATPGPPPTPAIIVVDNPRVDDTVHTHRLLGTSGSSTAGDTTGLAAIRNNRAGAFLTGTAAPATVGNRINVQFLKTGRYLVICMNRAHSLNDHMFGFVNVVEDEDDD